jgi:S-DNA-T family DNA segregation ATPase FtsK/SpoIIIE
MAAGEAPTSQANPEAPGKQATAKPMRKHATKGAQAPATDSREAALASATPAALPGLDMLNPEHEIQKAVDVRGLQDLIELTLADFNVPVKTVHVETGPTVTQFGVEPLYLERGGQRRKVRVSRIVNLADDLALALAVPAVRIEAPVPGRPYVGIEVPNSEKTKVSLRGILTSKAMAGDGGKLVLPLGRNTAGSPVVMDLTRAPHLLIAGATGSGKSVCINTIVTGLLMQHGPERLRFVMVDPKMVELPGYNGTPHLIGKVITEVDHVMGALTWLLLQMDDRYRLFQQTGVRNLEAYNALARKPRKGQEPIQPLPYIVLVIDELADLMMTAPEDMERQICRLAQMARATGIHLILATQRPSVDVVTGLIKANFPSRIAFAVSSQTDSRVILDTPGAERLLGQGDMLLMRPDAAKLLRIQGCFAADDEISRIVSFWQAQNMATSTGAPPWAGLLDQQDDEDELLQDAMDAIRDLERVNASLLQRKLRIGYPKAARLIDQLAARGVIGPDTGGSQGRPVLRQDTADTFMENDTELDE